MELSVDVNQRYLQRSSSNIIQRNSPQRITQNRERAENIRKMELFYLSQFNKKLLKDLEKDDKSFKILCVIIFGLLLLIIALIIYLTVFYKKDEDFQNYLNLNNSEVKYITSSEIVLLFNRFINQTFSTSKSIYTEPKIEYILHDVIYILPKLQFIKKFVKNDKYDKTVYKIDKNDCDNYSFILYGNFLKLMYNYNLSKVLLFGVGYVSKLESYGKFYKKHTQNVFIDENYDIYCVESQTDALLFCNETEYNIFRLIF
jgi:hypothetical protein